MLQASGLVAAYDYHRVPPGVRPMIGRTRVLGIIAAEPAGGRHYTESAPHWNL